MQFNASYTQLLSQSPFTVPINPAIAVYVVHARLDLRWRSLPSCHLRRWLSRRIVSVHADQTGPLHGAAVRLRYVVRRDARSTAGPWTAGCVSSRRTSERRSLTMTSKNLRHFTPTAGTLPFKPFIVSCTKALIYHANASRSCPPSSYLNYVDLSRLSAARRGVSSCLLSDVCSRSILHVAATSVELARSLRFLYEVVYE